MAGKGGVKGRLAPVAQLAGAEREAMLGLLSAHFHGVTARRFDLDLTEKQWALLLEEEARLVGFSTLRIEERTDSEGAPLTLLTSGDTIVERGAAASAALPKSWIAAVRTLRERHPHGPLHWLLLTSGFRTYRFLPVFWRSFWPRWDAPTPPEALRLLDSLARCRYGPLYDSESGVVRFPEPQVLRGDLAEIPPGRAADPHIAFFLRRNPGWIRGDELVCLTEIAEENLTPAGRRMWFAGDR